MGDGVAAIDRAPVDETSFLKCSSQEIGIDLRTRDMGLGLRPHRRGKRRGVISKTKVWRHAQIESDSRGRFQFYGRSRPRRPNEISAAIEKGERAGGEPLQRHVLQSRRPAAAIDRRIDGGAGDGGCATR